jgi:hypothetical protein
MENVTQQTILEHLKTDLGFSPAECDHYVVVFEEAGFVVVKRQPKIYMETTTNNAFEALMKRLGAVHENEDSGTYQIPIQTVEPAPTASRLTKDQTQIPCDFCKRPATLIEHFEEHLFVPQKINVCDSCHSRIHFQLIPKVIPRIKVPKSAVPFFQHLYPNIVAKNGELIFKGEDIFNNRYEVIDDAQWETLDTADAFPELKKIENLKATTEEA